MNRIELHEHLCKKKSVCDAPHVDFILVLSPSKRAFFNYVDKTRWVGSQKCQVLYGKDQFVSKVNFEVFI